MAEAKKTTKKVKEGATDGITQEVSSHTDQANPEKEVTKTKPKAAAKAGKHSAKAAKEAEEKAAKEERKVNNSDQPVAKPKQSQNPPRTVLERRSKQYRKLVEQIDNTKPYSLTEALNLAIKTSPVKFDATVELHVRLNVDPRHADQNLREMVVLPAGTGKTVKIAVLADPEASQAALKAGADVAGEDKVLAMLEKGAFDFDILIAQPMLMAKLGKYARVLGPKGLMPNPKSGTVAANVAKAVTEAKAGRVEFRVDSTGIVHLGIGKVSFGVDKLKQNAQAVFSSLKTAKPSSIKGVYVNTIFLTTTMGPSVSVNSTEI